MLFKEEIESSTWEFVFKEYCEFTSVAVMDEYTHLSDSGWFERSVFFLQSNFLFVW